MGDRSIIYGRPQHYLRPTAASSMADHSSVDGRPQLYAGLADRSTTRHGMMADRSTISSVLGSVERQVLGVEPFHVVGHHAPQPVPGTFDGSFDGSFDRCFGGSFDGCFDGSFNGSLDGTFDGI